MKKITIAFGSDHAGFELKQALIAHAQSQGWDVLDFGTDSIDPFDYPLIVPPVVDSLRTKAANFGVLICGSGIGVDIVANRFRGMRSALVNNEELARLSREHNDANILSLPARFISIETAIQCLDIFIKTKFSTEERHTRRLNMIDSFM